MNWWKNHKELGEFLALTIIWPALIYAAIFHTLDVDPYVGHAGVAAGLAITGMITWVIRNH